MRGIRLTNLNPVNPAVHLTNLLTSSTISPCHHDSRAICSIPYIVFNGCMWSVFWLVCHIPAPIVCNSTRSPVIDGNSPVELDRQYFDRKTVHH